MALLDDINAARAEKGEASVTFGAEGQPTVPFGTRAKMSFAETDPGRIGVLAEKYGAANVRQNQSGEFEFRQGDTWYPVDEPGLGWGDVADWAGDVPEIVGGGAGAIAATPLGPLAQVGAAGVGTGAGRGLKKMIGAGLGIQDEQTAGEIASDIGTSALFGAAGEGAGIGVAKGVQKVLRPSGGIAPQARSLMGDAAAIDVNLLPGQVTGGRNQQIVESTLQNSLGSAGTMQRAQSENFQALATEVDKLLETAGGRKAQQLVGAETKEALTKTTNLFKGTANKMFEEARMLAGDAPIAMTKYTELLDEIGKSITADFPTQSPEVMAKLRGVIEKKGQDLSFDDVKAIREEVSRLADAPSMIAEKKAGQFKRIRNAIDQDIASWAQSYGPDAAEAWEKARRFYGQKIGVLRGRSGRELELILEDAPEQVVRKVFVPGQTTKIAKIKNLVGEDGFETLRQGFLTDLFNDVKLEVIGSGPMGGVRFDTVSANKLASVIKKYGEPTLKEILTPEQYRRLIRLSDVAKASQGGIVNTSNTATVSGGQRMVNSLSSIATKGASGAAGATIVVPWALSKLILSGPGRSWLTTGVQVPKAATVGVEALFPGYAASLRRAGER